MDATFILLPAAELDIPRPSLLTSINASASQNSSRASSSASSSPPPSRISSRDRRPSAKALEMLLINEKAKQETTKLESIVADAPDSKKVAPRRRSPRTTTMSIGKAACSTKAPSPDSPVHSETISTTRSLDHVVHGYEADYVFRAERRNGALKIVRYEIEQRTPSPPLQDWEGEGMLTDGMSDPDFHWVCGPRVIFACGLPCSSCMGSQPVDIRSRYSPIRSKPKPRLVAGESVLISCGVVKKRVTGRRGRKARRRSS